MGERCADRNRVCTKAVVERGHVESPRERPLVVKATEEMRKRNSSRISVTSLGIWGFLILSHLKDMKMTFTKGIVDLLYCKTILEIDGGE